jgi:hypothetical protein
MAGIAMTPQYPIRLYSITSRHCTDKGNVNNYDNPATKAGVREILKNKCYFAGTKLR